MIAPRKKRAWEDKFTRLTRASQAAQEAVLVAIYEARRDGLSQADVAYMVGGVHPTGIKAKEEKGRAIHERRRGGNPT